MTLYVETMGRGPDVVLLHGWGVHGGVFKRLAESLSQHYCVHLVDLPGHGASSLVGDFLPEVIAKKLNEQFPLSVHVLGWSLGGLVAQHWAALANSSIKSLYLISTSPCFVKKEDWLFAQDRMSIEAVAQSLDQDFEMTLQRFLALQMLGAAHARETVKSISEHLFDHGRPQGLQAGLQCLLREDNRANIDKIRCPVRLFFGQKDKITPIEAGVWLNDHLYDSKLFTFEKASHAPFLSHENEFIEMIRQELHTHV